jgi:CRP-like cAMP-binding protein
MDMEAILKSIDFFSDVESEVIQKIAKSILYFEYDRDDIICRHGKFDDHFYVILSGSVRAVIPTEENPKFELFTLQEGDFFGEEIIFSTMPRENSIIVNESMLALTLDRDALKHLMNSSARIKSLIDKQYIDRKLRNDLRKVPIFTNLNEKLFQEVLESVELHSVAKNTVIFDEGDEGDSFYLIRNGEVKVYRDVEKKQRIIAILSEGEFFGEMALVSDEKRNASVEIAKNADLVKLSKEDFADITSKDSNLMKDLAAITAERKTHQNNVLKNPNLAFITRMLIDLNRDINRHLNIISQCTIDTEKGSALLATLPGSRYPYVYPRDSACASRLLYKLSNSGLKSGDIAFRLLGEISRFIYNCQREDGYWGQRYGINGEDKGIYKQEDNVAHGVSILCRYLLAAGKREVKLPNIEILIDAIDKGAEYAVKNFYRNEIHLFYSTTSIHESAIEEGYTIWVNYAYLMMLRLIEGVSDMYGVAGRFEKELELKSGFEQTIDNIFSISGRYVRRLKPDGVADLRPDITLLSPYFFGTGMENDAFRNNELFENSVHFIIDNLWDPDLGMLQRYLPFIEDPETHIHAGNGPWIQYTAMLAQYFFYTGNIDRGNEIMKVIDGYMSKEGHLCEHLTTPERFYEFLNLEWEPGRDYDKEFAPHILVPGMPYDNIVEEISHMKNSYIDVAEQCERVGESGYITFATPLMWSHAEYSMALMMRTDAELKNLEGKE